MSSEKEELSQKYSDLQSKFDELLNRFGANSPGTSDRDAQRQDLLRYFKCNDEGDTLLMKAIQCERMDVVKICLMFDEIDVNTQNEHGDKAIDIAWERRDYDCMLMLLSRDSAFPSKINIDTIDVVENKGRELRAFIEKRKLLHESIEKGILSSVKELTEKENSSTFYSPENVTAVCCAIENKKHEIYAYLLFIGAKLGEDEKALLDDCDDFQVEKFQSALEDYFIPFENSHISKLISATKLLGIHTDVERKAVKNIFEWLDTIPITKFLMKAVQYEKIEIIFDFNSELVDRVYPEYCSSEIYGLHVTKAHRIYIGAKNCILNEDGFFDVAGTVAHELCHRAMQMLYNNHAYPYNEGNKEREEIINNIHENVSKSLESIGVEITDETEKWEKTMKIYFLNPSPAELIVRVPHIFGIYGKDKGEKILKEKVPELFMHYLDHVHRDLVEFTCLPYFSKPLCSIEMLSKSIGVLSEEERCSSPFLSLMGYEDYMFELHGISVLLTSNPKLCMLHVYHVLKQQFPFHMEKQCLFIDLKDLDGNLEVISKVSQCKLFYCLVLLWREIDMETTDLQYITDIMEGDKRIILIANTKCKQLLQHVQKPKVVQYTWSSLVDDFKNKIMKKSVVFQGKNTYLYYLVNPVDASEVIKPEVLSYLMEEDNVNICTEFRTDPLFCSKSLYIPRSFNHFSYRSLIDNLERGSYYLLLTGLQKTAIEKFKVENRFILELEDERDFQPEKFLIVPKTNNHDLLFYQEYLKNVVKKIVNFPRNSICWLHHEDGAFYLQYSNGHIDADYHECEILKEEEIATKLQKQRVVIVADDPGAGKSTVISSLMDIIKRNNPYIFLGRINLNEYALETTHHLSLQHIKCCSSSEDILEYFYNILGLKNCLERSMMCYLQKVERKVIVLFDSFDEIVPLFKEVALKLLKTLLDETKIHICIFSRIHEKVDLEKELHSSSISLCPFSFKDQVKFLNNFWRLKLESLVISNEDEKIKCIERIEALILVLQDIDKGNDDQNVLDTMKRLRGFISHIQSMPLSTEKPISRDGKQFNEWDFEKYSISVLQNLNCGINEKGKPLTSLPLHLYMIANIIYNESFTVRLHDSIFNLYFDFLDSKIKTYLREKCQIKSETRDSKINFDVMREVILNTLTMVLGDLLRCNQPTSFLKKNENCLDIVQRIGLIKEEKGHMHFMHATIQEFVFFTLIKENIKSDTLEAELFSEILFKEVYQGTVDYLDRFFQTVDAPNVNFSDSFLKKFNVCEKFIDYLCYYEKNRKGCSFMGCNIWKKILCNHEKVSEKDKDDRLPPKIVLHLKKSFQYNFHKFEFLTLCLPDEMLIEIFDQNAKITIVPIINILENGPLNEVCEIIKLLNMILSHKRKTRLLYQVELSPELELFNVTIHNLPCGNLFHWVCSNRDENAFYKFFQFTTRFMDKKKLSDLLIEIDYLGDTILHHSSITGNRRILNILEELEVYLDEDHFSCLLSPETNQRRNFLNVVALWNSSEIYYKSLLEYLSAVMSCEAFEKLFLQLDVDKSSILHYAARNKNEKIFEITAEKISTFLQGEKLEKFVIWGSYYLRSMFHLRGEKCLEFKDLKIAEKYMRKEKFIELLMRRDQGGGTCAHSMCNSKSPIEVICSNISFISKELDEDFLEKFILTQDNHENTFLHILADKYKEMDMKMFYICLESNLSDSLLKNLLNKVNNSGQRVKVEKNERNVSFCMIEVPD